jgi:hypothetical protein
MVHLRKRSNLVWMEIEMHGGRRDETKMVVVGQIAKRPYGNGPASKD